MTQSLSDRKHRLITQILIHPHRAELLRLVRDQVADDASFRSVPTQQHR